MKNALTFLDGDPFEELTDPPQGFGVRQPSGALEEVGTFHSGRRQPHSKTQARKEMAAILSFCPKLRASAVHRHELPQINPYNPKPNQMQTDSDQKMNHPGTRVNLAAESALPDLLVPIYA